MTMPTPYETIPAAGNCAARTCRAAILAALSACSVAKHVGQPGSGPVLIALDFTGIGVSDWEDRTAASDAGSAAIEVDARGARLHVTAGDAQDKRISRRIDASAFHKKRVSARVHAVLGSHHALAFAAVKMSVHRLSGRADAWDAAISQPFTEGKDKNLEVVLDVPDDAASLEVELGVTGNAEVWFDTPRLLAAAAPVVRNDPPTPELIDALRSFAQLVGYLRFFHPSDEVARLEWTTFEAETVDRLLAAKGLANFQEVLRSVVAAVAPGARLYREGDRPPATSPPRGTATRLTRWVRIGSGDDGNPYSAFRTGFSEPADVGITLLRTVPSHGCKHVRVRLAATPDQSSPVFELYIIPRRGSGTPGVVSQVVPGIGSVEGDVPPEATAIMYGVRVGGDGVAEISKVELSCDKRVLGSFGDPGMAETFGTANHLYSVKTSRRCRECFTVTRQPENEYRSSSDEIDVPIGLGFRLRMPLAVWTDGKRTFPAVAPARELQRLPPGDRANRIASAIDIWATLRWFYPYFDDLQIDWNPSLTDALMMSARATSANELLAALNRLVTGLRDDHATVYFSGDDGGVLPLNFHYLDSKLYYNSGVGDYRAVFPKGSILDSIDGVSADALLVQATATISAATSAWLQAYLPLVLGEGPIGVMAAVRVKRPDGTFVTAHIPRVAGKFIRQKREERPANGSEIASGVYYVDFSTIDPDAWKALLPKLVTSRGLVCDARGSAPPAAFQILAHFIDHEIKSPYWDTPIASLTEKRYERSQSSIFPTSPRLSTQLVFVVDGRTASAPETILQYARAAGIGTVVGESTGGTNGNVASFDSLGGLRIRFTGMKVLNQDGSAFHGYGITPDLVVHPTPDGIQAGRDELLEAAIARIAAP